MIQTPVPFDRSGQDPAFAISAETGLRVGRHCDAEDALRFLNAAVGRNPLDLLRQTQRIMLLIDAQDSERLFGALTDLWLALGTAGTALRSKLLDLAAGQLGDDQIDYLRQHLQHGLSGASVLPVTTGSVLYGGLMGEVALVARVRAGAGNQREPLDEAIELLEHGHLDDARALLEQALLQDPGNAAIEGELLEIYRRSRDEAGFGDMRDRLRANGVALSPAWELL
jgi:hypothetical protein